MSVSKAAWGNYFPAPPLRGGGVRKFPEAALKFKNKTAPDINFETGARREVPTGVEVTNRRGQRVGMLTHRPDLHTGKQRVQSVRVEEPFRRRGAASRMMRRVEREQLGNVPLDHSRDRTAMGDKFARGFERKRGRGVVESRRESALRVSKGLDMVQKSFDDQPRDESGRWTKGGQVRHIRDGRMPEDMRHMGEEAFWDGYKVMTDLGKDHEFMLSEKETHEFDPKRIWTLVDEEDGSITAEAGFKPGAFGYLITKLPWTTGKEKGLYSEAVDDFDDWDEEDVEKSFIPGKGYVSASKIPKPQLKRLATWERRESLAEVRNADRAHFNNVREYNQAGRNVHAAIPGGRQTTVSTDKLKRALRTEAMEPEGVSINVGSKRTPARTFVRPGASKQVMDHEMAHATPKRSVYRSYQIGSNPRKHMREEARADFRAGVDYKVPRPNDSTYAQAARSREKAAELNSTFYGRRWKRPQMTNYRFVQDQMRAAGARQANVQKALRVVVLGEAPKRPLSFQRFIKPQRPRVSHAEVKAAYERAGFKNSAGKPRRLGENEISNALTPPNPALGAGRGILGSPSSYTSRNRVQKSWVPKVAGSGAKARTNARFFQGQYKPAVSLNRVERNQLRNHIDAQRIAREGLKGARIRRDPAGALNRVTVQRDALPVTNTRALAYAERSIKRKGHNFTQGDYTKRPKSLPEVLVRRTERGTLSPVSKALPNGMGVFRTPKHRYMTSQVSGDAIMRGPSLGQAMIINRKKVKRVPSAPQTAARVQRAWQAGGVRKSYIPGVGWRSASKLTARQKALVPGGHAKAQGMTQRDRAFQREQRELVSNIKSLTPAQRRKELGGVKLDPFAFNNSAATIRTGSAKRGQSYVFGATMRRGDRKQVQAHEDQHAKVKRSSYRLHRQIHSNKQKLMREEARADYRSMGHYSNKRMASGYADVARRREAALKAPNRPAKGSGPQARVLRDYGYSDWKRVTNQGAYEGSAMKAFGVVGYKMNPKTRDKSVDAYRDLQNHMRAKGVPEGQVRKSFTPWDGVRSEVSKMGPDQSELHIAGSSNQRRGKRLRKLPPDAIRRV